MENAQFHMPEQAMGQRVHEWRIEVESVNKIRRVNLQNVKSSLLAFFLYENHTTERMERKNEVRNENEIEGKRVK